MCAEDLEELVLIDNLNSVHRHVKDRGVCRRLRGPSKHKSTLLPLLLFFTLFSDSFFALAIVQVLNFVEFLEMGAHLPYEGLQVLGGLLDALDTVKVSHFGPLDAHLHLAAVNHFQFY